MNIVALIGLLALVLGNLDWFRDISDEFARLERAARRSMWT